MNYYRESEGLPISLISERFAFRINSSATNLHSKGFSGKSTGTTTVGLSGKDFVVLATDQRATLGNIAMDEDAQKIYQITNNIALTIAGGVGDAQAIVRFLKAQANLYEIERSTKMTPKALASLLSNVLNSNRYYPFMFQPIIGGVNTEAELFEIDPFGGISPKKNYAVTGSGTTLALATLDNEYKQNMNEDELIALAVKAINSAKNRDIYSGGKGINLVIIDKKGYRELSETEIEKSLKKIQNK